MYDKTLCGTATVGTKGQIVIPAEAREILNIQPGDKLFAVASAERGWVGFVKEQQLKALLNKLTENAERVSHTLADSGPGA